MGGTGIGELGSWGARITPAKHSHHATLMRDTYEVLASYLSLRLHTYSTYLGTQ